MSSTHESGSILSSSPFSSCSSQRHTKNNNAIDEDNQSSQLALILLLIGIIVPCVWIINWLMHRNSDNPKTRKYATISIILQIVEIMVVVVICVVFFVVPLIFMKAAIDNSK